MYPVFSAAIVVGYVPVIGPTTLDGFTALHVFIIRSPSAAPACVATDQCACNCAACGCNIFTASAADLMAQHAANECADDTAANVRVAALLVDDLLALDPAALFDRPHDSAHRCHWHVIDTLTRTPTIIVSRCRQWFRCFVLVGGLLVCRTNRGDTVVHAQAA